MNGPERVFHLAVAAEWEAALAGARYETSTLGRTVTEEGFTHCSHAHQVAAVGSRFYGGVDQLLLLLEIDPGQLTSAVVEEVPPGASEAYPHVYGPLDVTAVVAAHPVGRDPDGGFRWPDVVTGWGANGPSR